MPEFICPHCHGGFDGPRYDGDDGFCPWCGTAINCEYDPERLERVISRVVRDESDDSDGFLRKLLG